MEQVRLRPKICSRRAKENSCLRSSFLVRYLCKRIEANSALKKLACNEKGCGCTESTDIGTYDTCPHGCVYCYANMNKRQARKAFDNHDKESAFLGYSKSQSDFWFNEMK